MNDRTEPPAVKQYRKVFQHSNDAVMIVDLDAESFIEVNPAACEMLGYTHEEFHTLKPAELHPDDIDHVRDEFLTDVIKTGSSFTDDIQCLTKSGEVIPAEISGAALNPDADNPTKMIAILRDISDRVARRKSLQEKVDRLDRFASIISHDLRGPLSVIRANAELIRRNSEVDRADKIIDATEQMDQMLSDLLTLTREGNIIDSTTAVELNEVAENSYSEILTDEMSLIIESSLRFKADRERLKQLLANLFKNARDHAKPPVTVTIGRVNHGFYVADDGPGIPEDEREQVFQWGKTTSVDGTGFGLAIVADIADAHGWDIQIQTSAAGGARFEFRGVTELKTDD